jgi:transposase InsO family protein
MEGCNDGCTTNVYNTMPGCKCLAKSQYYRKRRPKGSNGLINTNQEEWQRRGIALFVLPPHSPKLNGYVERAQRTHTEKLYQVTNTGFEIAELNQSLLEQEKVYNTISSHQALGYFAPKEFLTLHQRNKRKKKVPLII